METLPWLRSEETFLKHLRMLGKIGSAVPPSSFIEAVVEERFLEEQMAGHGQPLLRWYSSDATPLSILRSATHNTASGSAKRRRKTREEYLVQLLYRRRCTGQTHADSILLFEAQLLEHGKSGSAVILTNGLCSEGLRQVGAPAASTWFYLHLVLYL